MLISSKKVIPQPDPLKQEHSILSSVNFTVPKEGNEDKDFGSLVAI